MGFQGSEDGFKNIFYVAYSTHVTFLLYQCVLSSTAVSMILVQLWLGFCNYVKAVSFISFYFPPVFFTVCSEMPQSVSETNNMIAVEVVKSIALKETKHF